MTTIALGRSVCGDLERAESHEWLVTNGLGGFACGTVAETLTRRYHGLLIAATEPPVGRRLLVAKLDALVRYDDRTYELSTDRWVGGAISPQGYRFIERFTLEGSVPTWTYAFADGLLEKRVWMEIGENTTYVRYDLIRASSSVHLECRAILDDRDFHGITHAGEGTPAVVAIPGGVRVATHDGGVIEVLADGGSCSPHPMWYRNYDLPVERARGLSDSEDHLSAATFAVDLVAGHGVTFAFSRGAIGTLDGTAAYARRRKHDDEVLAGHIVAGDPPWIQRLALAADQFVVARAFERDPDGRSIIAGYPWFGDWGRDTMISLPGLLLTTGRFTTARRVLVTYASYVDGGMLPNFFPDAGSKPEYNSVDSALWYIEAIRRYIEATGDRTILETVLPPMRDIVDSYAKGTRFGIRRDSLDGLLFAGEPGVQLTWMDAKVGDWVVTPRIGKPIEVNALWYSALCTVAALSGDDQYATMAAAAKVGFERYWNAEVGWLTDVLDGPYSDDASLRPNQIFAVSLPQSALEPERMAAVVDTCARRLLTSLGLRSLSPDDPAFRGRYAGDQHSRDGAYHQGTVWTWLAGPFALAHYRVYKDRAAALRILEPLGDALWSYGVGTLGEVADGDPPFGAQGCFAQAWSVAETLRAYRELTA